MRGGLGGASPTTRRPVDRPTPGPLWARAALRLSRAESARPPVVCLCPACLGWSAERGSVPSGWRASRAPALLNKAASRKLEWPLKRDRPREPASRKLYYSLSKSLGPACSPATCTAQTWTENPQGSVRPAEGGGARGCPGRGFLDAGWAGRKWDLRRRRAACSWCPGATDAGRVPGAGRPPPSPQGL